MAGMSHEYSKRDAIESVLKDTEIRVAPDRNYRGERRPDGTCEVWCEEANVTGVGDAAVSRSSRRDLPVCLEIRNHSPTGFDWGYGGSGPAQLALALLVDALGDVELAQSHYQDFKFEVVAGWGSSWSITAQQVRDFVAAKRIS